MLFIVLIWYLGEKTIKKYVEEDKYTFCLKRDHQLTQVLGPK